MQNQYDQGIKNKEDVMKQIRNTDLIRRNFLQVRIGMKSLLVTKHEDKPTICFETLIGSVGGILNLWIGISFFTLLEILELLYNAFKPVRVAPN